GGAAPPPRQAGGPWGGGERGWGDPPAPTRRAAFAAAEAAELKSPAAIAAFAAFVSGGSLAPPHVEAEVKPPENACALGVANAVQLATVITEPAKAPEKLARFHALGIDIATGKNVWKK